MANLSSFFGGSPARTEQTPTLSQPQQGLQNQAIQQLMSMLGQGGGSFAPIEKQARTNFQTNTIPGLAERFTSLGSGSQRSSAFQGALGQAGSGLEQGLASLKSQHGLQQQGLLSQLGMQPSFENNYFARQPGFGEQAGQGLASILPILGLILGGSFGGPGGAALGSTAGSAAGSGLQNLLAMLSSQGQNSTSSMFPQQGGGLTNRAYAPQPLNFGG